MNHTITNSNPRFIADAMLGRLAKKLRLLGYDCTYFSHIEDNDLLDIAKTEKRILLSKDGQLIKLAKKYHVSSVCICSDDQIEQILQINSIFELDNLKIDSTTARCSICNGSLEKTNKSSATGKIPNGILEITDNFWICVDCKKIYWEGTHIKNLQNFVGKLHERLS